MGQVIVEIGGRNYQLSCRDGDEPHLQGLAADIAAKAKSLTASLGQLSEARLLLMSALMIADELHDQRQKAPAAAPDVAADASPDLAELVERAEALADRLTA